jgi:hypothetical protein
MSTFMPRFFASCMNSTKSPGVPWRPSTRSSPRCRSRCRGSASLERRQPDGVHAQVMQVVEALDQPAEVAHAVAVGVEEGLQVEAVDHRVLVPQVVDHVIRVRRSPTAAASVKHRAAATQPCGLTLKNADAPRIIPPGGPIHQTRMIMPGRLEFLLAAAVAGALLWPAARS